MVKKKFFAGNYKPRPIRNGGRPVGRNELCPCGSGTKFKKCCGKPVVPKNPAPFEYRDMRSFYSPEQQKAAEAFEYRWGIVPNPEQLRVAMEESDDDQVAMMIQLIQSGNDCDPRYIAGVQAARRLATPRNQNRWTVAERDEYIEAMRAVGFYKGDTDESVPDAESGGGPAPGPDCVPGGEVQGSPAG
jgi:hypothetical protein